MILEPLEVRHAAEVATVLDDERLHEYIGGRPATSDQLAERYAGLVVGHSADGRQGWYNWIARDRQTRAVIGTVQATLHRDDGRLVAQIAWVVAVPHQGQGYATEAAAAMRDWLLEQGAEVLEAYVHPEHQASMGVARHLGLAPTGETRDGEVRWTA